MYAIEKILKVPNTASLKHSVQLLPLLALRLWFSLREEFYLSFQGSFSHGLGVEELSLGLSHIKTHHMTSHSGLGASAVFPVHCGQWSRFLCIS